MSIVKPTPVTQVVRALTGKHLLPPLQVGPPPLNLEQVRRVETNLRRAERARAKGRRYVTLLHPDTGKSFSVRTSEVPLR